MTVNCRDVVRPWLAALLLRQRLLQPAPPIQPRGMPVAFDRTPIVYPAQTMHITDRGYVRGHMLSIARYPINLVYRTLYILNPGD
jgi:hypothetical protein